MCRLPLCPHLQFGPPFLSAFGGPNFLHVATDYTTTAKASARVDEQQVP